MSFNVDGLNYCALAHDIVKQVPCVFCGAARGARCISAPSARYRLGRVLAPCRAHRPRIEAYWRTMSAAA